MSNRRRGINYERKLVDLLHEMGYAAVRVAGSGAKALPCPDVVACHKGDILAIEVKTTRKNQVYLSDNQVDDLKIYSRNAGAKPLVAVKFTHLDWYFLEPSEIPRTDGSVLVVSRDMATQEGLTSLDIKPMTEKV